MIYIEYRDAKEKDFLSLLLKTRMSTLTSIRESAETIDPDLFEETVHREMIKNAKGTYFDGKVKRTGDYAFPDIVASGYFGVEVKMTAKDQWKSTGNSVLETTRIEEVERIYIFFGKFGGVMDIKFRLYQECLSDVSVTHSPRYRIDMEIDKGKSIFEKMGVEYDVLRNDPNPIKVIKEYYRKLLKEGEELWWIDQETSEKTVSPIIRQFRLLTKQEKDNFVIEAMILFPEVFSDKQTKYERVAAYLISEYNTVSANLRDPFTAGGRVKIKIKGKAIAVPKIYKRLFSSAKSIRNRIEELDPEKIKYYWRVAKVKRDRLAQWGALLNAKASLKQRALSAFDVYKAGLE